MRNDPVRLMVLDATVFLEEQRRFLAEEGADALYLRESLGAGDLVERFANAATMLNEVEKTPGSANDSELERVHDDLEQLQEAMRNLIIENIVLRDAC